MGDLVVRAGWRSTRTSPRRARPGSAHLVRPLVERAAGREVEASVVPVAGEDPVADRAAMEREAHVRAAVVDRVHVVTVGEEAELCRSTWTTSLPAARTSLSDAAFTRCSGNCGHVLFLFHPVASGRRGLPQPTRRD